jgi:hypothetical protein
LFKILAFRNPAMEAMDPIPVTKPKKFLKTILPQQKKIIAKHLDMLI